MTGIIPKRHRMNLVRMELPFLTAEAPLSRCIQNLYDKVVHILRRFAFLHELIPKCHHAVNQQTVFKVRQLKLSLLSHRFHPLSYTWCCGIGCGCENKFLCIQFCSPFKFYIVLLAEQKNASVLISKYRGIGFNILNYPGSTRSASYP